MTAVLSFTFANKTQSTIRYLKQNFHFAKQHHFTLRTPIKVFKLHHRL
jgi:hypothetical protein